jgi:hypothetical protein
LKRASHCFKRLWVSVDVVEVQMRRLGGRLSRRGHGMERNPSSAGEGGDRLAAVADELIAGCDDSGERGSHGSAVDLGQDPRRKSLPCGRGRRGRECCPDEGPDVEPFRRVPKSTPNAIRAKFVIHALEVGPRDGLWPHSIPGESRSLRPLLNPAMPSPKKKRSIIPQVGSSGTDVASALLAVEASEAVGVESSELAIGGARPKS